MRERFSGGSANKRGNLNPPKTNSFPAHNPVVEPIIQTNTIAKLRRFVPSGVPIERSGLQEEKPHTNNVGCPPTPGHIVIPVVRVRVEKARKVRNKGEIGGGTSEEALQRAKKNQKR